MESIEDILKKRKAIEKKIIFYSNDKGEKVEKEEATRMTIVEYDKDGNIVNEIHGICNNKENLSKEEER